MDQSWDEVKELGMGLQINHRRTGGMNFDQLEPHPVHGCEKLLNVLVY